MSIDVISNKYRNRDVNMSILLIRKYPRKIYPRIFNHQSHSPFQTDKVPFDEATLPARRGSTRTHSANALPKARAVASAMSRDRPLSLRVCTWTVERISTERESSTWWNISQERMRPHTNFSPAWCDGDGDGDGDGDSVMVMVVL